MSVVGQLRLPLMRENVVQCALFIYRTRMCVAIQSAFRIAQRILANISIVEVSRNASLNSDSAYDKKVAEVRGRQVAQ